MGVTSWQYQAIAMFPQEFGVLSGRASLLEVPALIAHSQQCCGQQVQATEQTSLFSLCRSENLT